MPRPRETEVEGGGPGLFFVLVALVVVAVLGARYLGFYPNADKNRQSLGGKPQQVTTARPGEPAPAAAGVASPSAAGSQQGTAGSYSSLGAQGGPPQVMIYYSFASQNYGPGDPYASGQPGQIVSVGQTLTEGLAIRGVSALHDTTVFDYPVFKNALPLAAEAMASNLQRNPSVELVLDVHRDALPPGSPASATTVQLNGQPVARIMIGVPDGPGKEQRLALARELEGRMEEMYPGLCRGVKELGSSGAATDRALSVYIGSYPQNTLAEAQRAAKLLADVVATLVSETPPSSAPPTVH
ncbi:MAG: stage II sporulation protein P [Firmicutes bacterium]|nr:stage II sporulation protein P [Bacillota bacterium]